MRLIRLRENMPKYESCAMWLKRAVCVVTVSTVTTGVWSAFADDKENTADLPVVEATIPETLHPNDFALTPADRAITARVRATLLATPFVPLDTDTIAVQTRRGEVTLLGSIRSQALKREIDLRVPLIPGVKALNNQLTVESKAEHDP